MPQSNIVKPWSEEFFENFEGSDEELEMIWKGYSAEYFVVDIAIYDGSTTISVCPIEYFKEFGYCYDEPMFLDHILPEDFSECMESIYDTERTPEEVEIDLRQRGFQFSQEFSEFLNESFGTDEYRSTLNW